MHCLARSSESPGKKKKNRHGLEVKCAATYFSPLSLQSTRPLCVSLALLPRASSSSEAQRRQGTWNWHRYQNCCLNGFFFYLKSTHKSLQCNSILLTWWRQTSFVYFGFNLEGSVNAVHFRQPAFYTRSCMTSHPQRV